MANRVDATEVKEIIETALSDAVIEAFIGAANITVTGFLGSSTLTAAQLKEIERWFTAHLIASTRERQKASEGAGGASVTWHGNTDMGLDATLYGQQVKLLDTTGTFSALAVTGGLKAVQIYAIPSFDEEEENIDT